MEHIEIPPHVQRLREDHEQNEYRLRKLKAFFNNPLFTTLDPQEQSDMALQENLMANLDKVLTRRLARALEQV